MPYYGIEAFADREKAIVTLFAGTKMVARKMRLLIDKIERCNEREREIVGIAVKPRKRAG